MPDISKWNIHGTEYNVADATARATLSEMPTDVQINGTSIVSEGVANIPYATTSAPGLVYPGTYGTNGLSVNTSTGLLTTSPANDSNIKNGNVNYKPIVSSTQHQSVFYGLAKAAGDSTQSASANPVGTYTDNAKSAIRTMLGVSDEYGMNEVTVAGADPVITAVANTRYLCGTVATLSITPPASGIVDVMFTSGSTATVLTLPTDSGGSITVKFPNGFDPTSLDINTIYEINIADGVYGAVVSWEA